MDEQFQQFVDRVTAESVGDPEARGEWTRFFIYALLVPVALLVAFIFGYGRLIHAENLAFPDEWVNHKVWNLQSPSYPIPHFPPFRSPAQQFEAKTSARLFFNGEGGQYSEWFASLWRAHPDNAIYQGYYINTLFSLKFSHFQTQ